MMTKRPEIYAPVAPLLSLRGADNPRLNPEELSVEEREDDVRDDDTESELKKLLGGVLVPEAVLKAAEDVAGSEAESRRLCDLHTLPTAAAQQPAARATTTQRR